MLRCGRCSFTVNNNVNDEYIIAAGGYMHLSVRLLLRRICLYKALCVSFYSAVYVYFLNSVWWRLVAVLPPFLPLYPLSPPPLDRPLLPSTNTWIRGNNEGILWFNPFYCRVSEFIVRWHAFRNSHGKTDWPIGEQVPQRIGKRCRLMSEILTPN